MEAMMELDLTEWTYAGLQDLHNLIRSQQRFKGDDWCDDQLNDIQEELWERDRRRMGA